MREVEVLGPQQLQVHFTVNAWKCAYYYTYFAMELAIETKYCRKMCHFYQVYNRYITKPEAALSSFTLGHNCYWVAAELSVVHNILSFSDSRGGACGIFQTEHSP